MKIESIILRNFRCFADSPVTVELAEDLTALVGANGSGKTALLTALTRLFGTTQNMRTIRRSDFHVPPGGATDDPSSVELSIEVVLIFPELSGGAETSNSVAPAFNHMIVDSPGGDPFCRLRLEARRTDDGTIEGHVEQDLYWILTVEDPVPDNKKQRVTPNDRGRVQVHYIPANRDPAPEFRSAARNSAGRLVRAISWVQGTRDAVQTASEKIRDTLGSEQALSVINGLLQRRSRPCSRASRLLRITCGSGRITQAGQGRQNACAVNVVRRSQASQQPAAPAQSWRASFVVRNSTAAEGARAIRSGPSRWPPRRNACTPLRTARRPC